MSKVTAGLGDEGFLVALNILAGETGKIIHGKSLDACFASVVYHEMRTERILSVARAVIFNHPFIDGNKRTATLFIGCMCQLSGVTLRHITNEEWADMVVKVAVEHWTVQQMKAWLLPRIDLK